MKKKQQFFVMVKTELSFPQNNLPKFFDLPFSSL